MADLYQEAREALATATDAIEALNQKADVDCTPKVKLALIALFDTISALHRLVGTPNAVEPERGTPHVITNNVITNNKIQ